ncbi:uncharacterized protein LOC128861474 isoform X2 [Anastrepha ludens]|uniref:uncharacterized protein LOC128861474 isoform X2 n=1 Tax=Anastrepha ludens TaxID=28586 RepID=UPI0023AFE0FF|nr:uncharacterized protein LOC128861474 isoform X2 [Anastrepha ludens]
MNMQILIISTLIVACSVTQAQPVDKSDAIVDNLWETTSIQTWPWTIRPAALSVNLSPLTPIVLATAPAGNLNLDKLISQPQLIEMFQLLQTNKFVHKSTPTYFTPFAISPVSFPLLRGEATEKLINEAESQKKEKIGEEILQKNTKEIPVPAATKKAYSQPKPNAADTNKGGFKSDARLLQAVKQINPEFVIEEIISVPGQHILSTLSSEKFPKPLKFSAASSAFPQLISNNKSPPKKISTQKLNISKHPSTEPGADDSEVKVEAIGHTATSGIIPQIPFDTYFLPYHAQSQKDLTKAAALILEPHSKAVVGNGGTAISAPISRAFLKQGVPTNVYFNPESVAIAGVGGKAHAQADLELDLVDSRK